MIPTVLLFIGGFLLFLSPAKAQERIAVILMAPLSGSLKEIGIHSLAGIQLAIDDMNSSEGLRGKRIKLFPVDSPLKPEVAAEQAEKAIREMKARWILQVGPSSVARALMDIAQRKQVILVSLGMAEDEQLTGKDLNPYFFRTGLTIRNRAQAYAEFFRTKPWRKFYLIHGNGRFHSGGVEDFKREMKEKVSDFQVVGEELIAEGENDHEARLCQIHNSGAQVVFTGQWGKGLEKMIQQAARMELKVRFATYYQGEPSWVTKLAQAAEGSWVLSGYLPTVDTPENHRFVMRWKEKQNNASIPWPTASAGLAYQGTEFFLRAIRKAKALDNESIIRSWEDMAYDGLVGRLFMRACDHQTLMPAVIGEIQKRPLLFPALFPTVPIIVPMDKVAVSFAETANPRCK